MDHALLKSVIDGRESPQLWLDELLPVVGSVGSSALLIWVAQTGVLPKLRVLAKDAESPLQGVADASVILIQTNTDLDLGQPQVAALVDLLRDAGVITSAQHDALFAKATTLVPRWQALGFERQPDFGDIDCANLL